MDLFWTIFTGFAVGLLAKLVSRGPHKPAGFLLTTLVGIAGAFVGTFLGQFVGYLRPGEQGNFVISIIGAVVVLALWSWIAKRARS